MNGRRRRDLLGSLLLAAVASSPAWWGRTARAAEPPNGYSGIASVGEATYLVVKDYKTPRSTEPRIGILRITPQGGSDYRPIAVTDWKDADGPASDLEACCEVPGRPGEFLLSESAAYQGRFGRVFHIRLDRQSEEWTATVLGVLKGVLPRPEKVEPGDEVEGLACLRRADGQLILVVGHRGGPVGREIKTARIVWGKLDLDSGTFHRSGEAPLVSDSALGERGCADLLLEPRDDSWAVWSVASDDAGDLGPFRSVVYRAGTLVPDPGGGIRFQAESRPRVRWRLDGLKVEALGRTVGVPRSTFCVATDDEVYGGAWRPLFEAAAESDGNP